MLQRGTLRNQSRASNTLDLFCAACPTLCLHLLQEESTMPGNVSILDPARQCLAHPKGSWQYTGRTPAALLRWPSSACTLFYVCLWHVHKLRLYLFQRTSSGHPSQTLMPLTSFAAPTSRKATSQYPLLTLSSRPAQLTFFRYGRLHEQAHTAELRFLRSSQPDGLRNTDAYWRRSRGAKVWQKCLREWDEDSGSRVSTSRLFQRHLLDRETDFRHRGGALGAA